MSEPFLSGRLAPYISEANVQNVSSALDDITQGIAASPGGISNIQNMLDAFAPFADLGLQDTGLPAMQSFADVGAPSDYLSGLKGQSINQEGSLFPFSQILPYLEDQQFDAGKGLLASSENLFGGKGILENLTGKDGLLGASLAGVKFAPATVEFVPNQPGTLQAARDLSELTDRLKCDGGGELQQKIDNASSERPPSSGIGEKAVIVVGGKEEEGAEGSRSATTDKPPSAIGDKSIIIVNSKEIEVDKLSPEFWESAAGEKFVVIPSDRQLLSDRAVITPTDSQLADERAVITPTDSQLPGDSEFLIPIINDAPDPDAQDVGKSLIWKSAPQAQSSDVPFQIAGFEDTLRAMFDVDPFSDRGKQLLADFAGRMQALVNMEASVKSGAELYRQVEDATGPKIIE